MTTEDHYSPLLPELVVEARGDVRLVTLTAPDRLNAVDAAMHRKLLQLWALLWDDEGAGAVVLTGAGRAFCAGGYYADLLDYHRDRAIRARAMRDAERLVRSMVECQLPVVSAVNGPAIGLGASLALLSDLVVMADDAYLSDPHVSVGVVAGDGGVVTWPLAAGLLRAKEYLLLGDRVDATECHRIGLANRVVSSSEVVDGALELAARLADQPRQALMDTKRALNQYLSMSSNLVLPLGITAERDSFASPEVAATVASFETRDDGA